MTVMANKKTKSISPAFDRLDHKKRAAIDLLLEGKLNDTQIAEQIGKTRITLYNWKNNTDFIKARDERRHQFSSETTDSALVALKDILKHGTSEIAKVKAIKLQLTIDGWSTDESKVMRNLKIDKLTEEVKTLADNNNHDDSDQAPVINVFRGGRDKNDNK